MAPISSKPTVAQSVFTPISSNSTVAHAVMHKLYGKRHFKVLCTFFTFFQFRATWQWRTLFGTGFSFLTIRANLKQNEIYAVWFGANLEQQHKWTCCFPKVLSPTANPAFSDIFYPTHQLRYIYSCALFFAQALGQTVRIFCQVVFHKFYLQQQIQVSWILLTTHTNLSKLTAARPVSTPALSHTVRMFCQVVVFFTILTKDANF